MCRFTSGNGLYPVSFLGLLYPHWNSINEKDSNLLSYQERNQTFIALRFCASAVVAASAFLVSPPDKVLNLKMSGNI